MSGNLRILRDEVRNEEFYYLNGRQVYPEDMVRFEEDAHCDITECCHNEEGACCNGSDICRIEYR